MFEYLICVSIGVFGWGVCLIWVSVWVFGCVNECLSGEFITNLIMGNLCNMSACLSDVE